MAGARVSIREVSRRFSLAGEEVWALRDVSLDIAAGEFVALIGRSGSGKTTLLNLIAGLDRPTEGDILIDEHNIGGMSEKELVKLRRGTVGFVFQSFGLLPLLSAAENVELPLRIAGHGLRERNRRVRRVLDMVGLGRRAEHRPYELSGGEQQRVAIARALAMQPRLILADEPTGELDSNTALTIFTLLRDVSQSEGMTIITSTHDRLVIELAERVEELANGRHVADGTLKQFVVSRERSPFAAVGTTPVTVGAAAGPATASAAPGPSVAFPPSPPITVGSAADGALPAGDRERWAPRPVGNATESAMVSTDSGEGAPESSVPDTELAAMGRDAPPAGTAAAPAGPPPVAPSSTEAAPHAASSQWARPVMPQSATPSGSYEPAAAVREAPSAPSADDIQRWAPPPRDR